MNASESAVAAKKPAKNTEQDFIPLTQKDIAGLMFSSFQSDQPISILRDLPGVTETKMPTLHLRELIPHSSGSSVAWQMQGETRNYFGENPRIDPATGQIRFDTDKGIVVTLTPKTHLQ